MNNKTVVTSKIVREFVEGTGRGYLVGVVVAGGRKVDLAVYRHDGTTKSIDAAYNSASNAANGIKRGAFISRYAHGSNPIPNVCVVKGRVLTIERAA